MNFGQRLRLLRKKKKISQKSLGEVLGMSQENISFYENGKREPDISTLRKIAEYFNVSLDYLLVLDSRLLKGRQKSDTSHKILDIMDLSQAQIDDVKKYIDFLRNKE